VDGVTVTFVLFTFCLYLHMRSLVVHFFSSICEFHLEHNNKVP